MANYVLVTNLIFFPDLNETELEAALSARGSNYSLMRSHHMTHKTNEERLVREATYFEFTTWSSFQCGKDFYKESTRC